MLAAFVLSVMTIPVPDPRVLAMLRFPSVDACNVAIADGEAHLAFWEALLAAGLCRHDQAKAEQYVQRVRDSIVAWRLLRECWYDMRYQWSFHHWFLGEIERLEDMLGPECFASGLMPYPVAEHWRIEPRKKTVAVEPGWL